MDTSNVSAVLKDDCFFDFKTREGIGRLCPIKSPYLSESPYTFISSKKAIENLREDTLGCEKSILRFAIENFHSKNGGKLSFCFQNIDKSRSIYRVKVYDLQKLDQVNDNACDPRKFEQVDDEAKKWLNSGKITLSTPTISPKFSVLKTSGKVLDVYGMLQFQDENIHCLVTLCGMNDIKNDSSRWSFFRK